jgi:hypothetical protein
MAVTSKLGISRGAAALEDGVCAEPRTAAHIKLSTRKIRIGMFASHHA